MRANLRKIALAGMASLLVGAASLAMTGAASAQHHHGGWHGHHGGGWGGFGAGFALGALAAPRYYYDGPYAYYGDDCYWRRRVVGRTESGRLIVRRVRVCY